jgi:hypothetical protein
MEGKMRFRYSAIVALLLAGSLGLAQQPPNPRGTATTTVNGKTVTIDYGRPSLKGRKFEELMKGLQADRIWRAGENQVTTLDTPIDLMIGNQKVPAGKYSLYVHIPATGDSSLVVNRDLGIELKKIWAEAPPALAKEPWPNLMGGYDKIAGKEVARVKLEISTPKDPVEMFTITLPPGGSGNLMLAWGDKSWSAPIKPAS